MSHAWGEVIHDGRVVGYFEYDGTADVAREKIHPAWDSLMREWRQVSDYRCACGRPPVGVTLYADYGGGFYWPAEACLGCGVITSYRSPYDEAILGLVDGHPLGTVTHKPRPVGATE